MSADADAAPRHDSGSERPRMRVVITGAAGLIGSRLVERLASTCEVWAISRSAAPQPVGDSVRWVVADVAALSLASVLPATADVVVHLAQSPHYRDFPERAEDVFDVNVASTARLLDWSYRAGVRHFVLASSGGVGSHRDTPSFYLACKHSAELLLEAYADQFAILVLRFFFVYGRGQRASMLVPRLVQAVRAAEPIRVTGSEGPRLNPVHVDDAAKAVEAAIAQRATGCIDVAGPEILSLRQMCIAIATRLNTHVEFLNVTGEPQDLVGDITLMTERFGRPRRLFSNGVVEMLGEPATES